MKKLVGSLFVAVFALTGAGGSQAFEIVPNIRYQLPGRVEVGMDDFAVKGDADGGFGAGVEVLSGGVDHDDRFRIGGGALYLFDREMTETGGVTLARETQFRFLPVYAALKHYPFPRSPQAFDPFVKLHLGYSVVFDGNEEFVTGADLGGGIYYALGGGTDIGDHLSLEVLYSVFRGDVETSGGSKDFTYSTVSLVAGYRFRL